MLLNGSCDSHFLIRFRSWGCEDNTKHHEKIVRAGNTAVTRAGYSAEGRFCISFATAGFWSAQKLYCALCYEPGLDFKLGLGTHCCAFTWPNKGGRGEEQSVRFIEEWDHHPSYCSKPVQAQKDLQQSSALAYFSSFQSQWEIYPST